MAIQADEDEDDDQAVEDSDEEGGDGEQEEQEQGEAEEATEGASKPMDPSAALEAAQLGWREFGPMSWWPPARSGFVGPTPIQTACCLLRCTAGVT